MSDSDHNLGAEHEGATTGPNFSDLLRFCRRQAPRYDRAYGQCAACGLGFTTLVELDSVVFGCCLSCGTRRVAGVNLFESSDQATPHELGLTYEDLFLLAGSFDACESLSDGASKMIEPGAVTNRAAQPRARSWQEWVQIDDPLPHDLTENLALILKGRQDRRDRAAAEDKQRRILAEQEAAEVDLLEQGARRRQVESLEQGACRRRLAEAFERNVGFYYPLGGTWVSGSECGRRVMAGADFSIYHRLLPFARWYREIAPELAAR